EVDKPSYLANADVAGIRMLRMALPVPRPAKHVARRKPDHIRVRALRNQPARPANPARHRSRSGTAKRGVHAKEGSALFPKRSRQPCSPFPVPCSLLPVLAVQQLRVLQRQRGTAMPFGPPNRMAWGGSSLAARRA